MSFAADTQERHIGTSPDYMSPCLEDCPNEIIEATVVLLDLDNIRSLSQSCWSPATKSTQNHFKSYYYSKHVDISLQTLRVFVDATQPGRLGCLVQKSILVDHTNGSDRHNSKPQRQYGSEETELDLLSQEFNGIAAYKKSGELLSLSLEAAYIEYDDHGFLGPLPGRQLVDNRYDLLEASKLNGELVVSQ